MMGELHFPLKKDTSRKTIHIDMDALFASVEERDHPEPVRHPLVIMCHLSDTGDKEVVTTVNYTARRYDIHSAMSTQKVYELCPGAIFKPGNCQKHSEVLQGIREIFRCYIDVIELVSIDETYLDITGNRANSKSAIKIAKMIRHDIQHESQLTYSTGVSYNKFPAKLAPDFQEPKDLMAVLPEEAEDFLRVPPVGDFHGIGEETMSEMYGLGVSTGADLCRQGEMTLIRLFGKMGYSLHRKVRDIHDAPVQMTRDRKSVGKEHTHGTPLATEEQATAQLRQLAVGIECALQRVRKHGKTIVLKVRYTDYMAITKRVTLPEYISEKEELFYQANLIREDISGLEQGIRLLGITLTNLDPLAYENIVLPSWEEN